MLGESWTRCGRAGRIATRRCGERRKVAIVERASPLSRHDLDPETFEIAEQLLTDHAAILAPPELSRFAHAVVNAADPDGPQPVDDQLQQDRRYLELKQRRDGMWHLAGRLSNTVGAQLNAILDPLDETPDHTSKTPDGHRPEIPDPRGHCNDCTTPWTSP